LCFNDNIFPDIKRVTKYLNEMIQKRARFETERNW